MADFQAYFFNFLIWLIPATLILAFFKSTRAKSHLLPSPFPIIGHLHLLSPTPHQAFHRLSLRYGPFFRLMMGSEPCVVAYFAFVPYGSYWRFMKKIIMSELLNGATIDSLHVRQDEINRFIKSLSQKANIGEAVHINAELVKGFGKRVKDYHRMFDALMERIIKEHEEARMQGLQSEGKDLLNILLDIAEDDTKEIHLTRENIKAFILEQTIQRLSELINHPNIMRKAIEEIDNVGPEYWEKPLAFRPERFQEKQMDVRGHHYELLPFGSGRRMCSGASLGLQMVHATFGAMIQCFEWKAGKDGNLTSVDMDEKPGFNLPRANPLICVPVARIV
ncbi:hypothetical protein L1987_13822 [Smallanthus sonchifolius]|uniref:Uncharacterized protein n=1 Tax=Smallanthus sonchifolius TaxID=185202 RepID=A0ACB9JHI3_9ASTR|nr:hypothetical protein L1987_13822 [Smallanthus sonchifolius]